MLHLDNPEKKQYSRDLLVEHGGANAADMLKLSSSERYQKIAEMQSWVKKSDCMDFWQLLDFAQSEHMEDWYPLLCDNSSYVMGEYIKSRRNFTVAERRDRLMSENRQAKAERSRRIGCVHSRRRYV